MHDPTEQARRDLLRTVPDELRARVEAGEPVLTTEQMRAEYEVIGFAAPFVVVRRKSDGAKGSLMFSHMPRFYFGWAADQ